MIAVIRTIFIFLSFVILTSAWVYLSSNLSFYIKKYILKGTSKLGVLVSTIIVWFILELLLAMCSLLAKAVYNGNQHDIANNIRHWLETGIDYSVIASPVSSMVGAFIGVRCNIPPWKRV